MAQSDFDLEYGLSMPAGFELDLQVLSTILAVNEADDELPAQDPVQANPLNNPAPEIVFAETSNVSSIPPQENQSNIETNLANDLLAFQQQQEQELFGTSYQRVHKISSHEFDEPAPEDSDTDSEGESIEQDMMQVDSSLEEDVMDAGSMDRVMLEVCNMDQQDMEIDNQQLVMSPHHSTDVQESFHPNLRPESDLQEHRYQVQAGGSQLHALHLEVLIQESSWQVEGVLPDSESETSGADSNIMESVPVNLSHSVGVHLQLKVLIQEDSEQVDPAIRGSKSEASGAVNNIAESVLPDHQAPNSSPAGMPPIEDRFTKELSSQIDLKADAGVPVSLAMFPVTDHGISVPVKKAADDGNATQLEGNHQ